VKTTTHSNAMKATIIALMKIEMKAP